MHDKVVAKPAHFGLAVRIGLLKGREACAEDRRMDAAEMPNVELMRLRCQECAHLSDDAARGWRTFLAPDPDEPEAGPMLATYCPQCAAREFGLYLEEPSRPTGRVE
jgi:hypothetical protein